MQKIVLASNNPGKLNEFAYLSQTLHWELIPQNHFSIAEIPETANTFVENAFIKARHAAYHAKLPALSDDSGLIVDALNGEPGVYSARYAGEKASAKACIEKLLINLQDVPEEKRTARFVCVLVYMRHADDPLPIIAQGVWEGKILFKLQGENGFGYDPIFYVPTHHCSAAELNTEEKNRLSHRARAMESICKLIPR